MFVAIHGYYIMFSNGYYVALFMAMGYGLSYSNTIVNGYCITMGVWLPFSKRLLFKNAKVFC